MQGYPPPWTEWMIDLHVCENTTFPRWQDSIPVGSTPLACRLYTVVLPCWWGGGGGAAPLGIGYPNPLKGHGTSDTLPLKRNMGQDKTSYSPPEQNDSRHQWKHHLPATSLAGDNNSITDCAFQYQETISCSPGTTYSFEPLINSSSTDGTNFFISFHLIFAFSVISSLSSTSCIPLSTANFLAPSPPSKQWSDCIWRKYWYQK